MPQFHRGRALTRNVIKTNDKELINCFEKIKFEKRTQINFETCLKLGGRLEEYNRSFFSCGNVKILPGRGLDNAELVRHTNG